MYKVTKQLRLSYNINLQILMDFNVNLMNVSLYIQGKSLYIFKFK